MENWIVYDGDVTIDDFVDKNKPTKINFINMGVFAGDPKERPREFQYPHAIAEPQKTTLLQEWEQRIKKPWRITRYYVQKLAKKYAYMSGKWIIYCPRSKIDETWTAIAKAVVGGTSGTAANMFESDSGEQESYYVICVYTEDFTNEEEVWAAEQSLRKLGITEILYYKPNIYTTVGIYRGNEWGIRPTIYQSRACK